MPDDVTYEFLDEFAAAWNRHDVDAILNHMTPDGVLLNSMGASPWGRRSVGREEIRRAIIDLFAAFPDACWNDPKHFIAGDRGVTEWVFTGTGPNGPVESHGCDVFTFAEGKIAVKDSYRKHVTG
ncbi:nuclear transport factor 2 family protein [Salinarimonas ramus]|uniref:Transcriptional regulator n=1 Tax=Salinarimonas ramus TaxID=690164 RepID=A0A917QL32_9HYPH|nr:nuclear transport factor 2 family protein [Salinarimonas ramus]GGK55781.1 transcriptional regulator [Salinarimonas ramus]